MTLLLKYSVQTFKKIEVYGFKSFADKLEVDFSDGVTCIVGPNGCGKSNVSDAIRWVLGEQSSKALRGSQMQDVIFKGTEKRQPLGYCEVSLHFDNTEHIFPIDYSEVVLTRKLFRSGESEYQINKKECRLKDITGILHDSGIDRDGLTIISQGQVSEIITAKPESRRDIFEEAAGIAKIKSVKVEAIRKLDRTRIDLERVTHVIQELHNNLAPLMKQAEKAEKYIVLRDELKNLEINTYITMYDNAAAEKEKLRIELENIDTLTKDKQVEIMNRSRQITSFSDQITALDKETEDLREQVLNLSVGLEREQNNKRFEIYEKLNELKQERAGLESKKRTIEHLIESGEGYKFSVRKLMATKHKAIIGVVAQELKVPKHLEAAIEVALGAAAQNIITHDENGAKQLIEYLRRENSGRATFLPLTSVSVRTLKQDELRLINNHRNVLGCACDLVKYDAKIQPVVQALLGRTVIVDNLENAIELAREMKYSAKLVTLDGDVIETRGSITGGAKSALNNNLWHTNNLAMIDDALGALNAKIQTIEIQINDDQNQANQDVASMSKLEAVRELLDKIGETKSMLKHDISKLEFEKIKLSDDIAEHTRAYYKLEAALARVDIDIEQMQARIDEEYGMNYSACFVYLQDQKIERIPLGDLETATKLVSGLKRQINALGPVNLDVIEQSRDAKQRYDDYSTQVADLEKAKSDLEKVINDLSKEMVTKFRDSFETINKNFGIVFKELFGGGNAKLQLVPNAEGKVDYLESGIEIIAEPPGKKLGSLALLSGGEKALTAIAILFAILKLKPMPFCLLDEIEAALDEANVTRFAEYLGKFSGTTQFIVITHRKPTMELANNLYGVTMEEKGVSKLVSVKLEAVEDDKIDVDLPSEGVINA